MEIMLKIYSVKEKEKRGKGKGERGKGEGDMGKGNRLYSSLTSKGEPSDPFPGLLD